MQRKTAVAFSCALKPSKCIQMVKNSTMSSVQLSLFPCQGSSVNDAQNGNQQIAKLSNYLKTRGGLWRLLALFPGNMSVEDALRLAPSVLTKCRKEVAL